MHKYPNDSILVCFIKLFSTISGDQDFPKWAKIAHAQLISRLKKNFPNFINQALSLKITVPLTNPIAINTNLMSFGTRHPIIYNSVQSLQFFIDHKNVINLLSYESRTQKEVSIFRNISETPLVFRPISSKTHRTIDPVEQNLKEKIKKLKALQKWLHLQFVKKRQSCYYSQYPEKKNH